MLSHIQRANIYEITVEPCTGFTWSGMFTFHPDASDVEAAIIYDINELDSGLEHGRDAIQSLKMILELVILPRPKLLGSVKIAGTHIGEISIANIKVFEREIQAAMPVLEDF